MSLKKKDILVFNMIYSNSTIENILLNINSCERNLRYIIDNLNYYLIKILNKKILKRKTFFSIDISEEEKNLFLSKIYAYYYCFVQEERVEYLFLSFLFLEKIKLCNLEKELDITRATLKKDLFILTEKLKNYGLEIQNKNNNLFLIGNEKKYRHLKCMKFLEYSSKISPFKLNFISYFNNKSLLRKIKEIIIKVESIFNTTFPKEFIELMNIFIYISFERINSNFIINKKSNYKFLINTFQYNVVKQNFSDLIPTNLTFEIAHLTEYFLSYGIEENLSEFKFCVEQYLSHLFIEINNYLKKDINWKKLKSELIYYLVPALYRLRNNFYIGEIGEKNNFFSLIEDFSDSEAFLPEKLSKFEIFYLSKKIEEFYLQDQLKIIDLNKIIEIAKKHSFSLDEKNFSKELLTLYEKYIKY